MRVEIWSDVACPWCYLGTAQFERAVAETGVEAEVVYRSFQLDPSTPMGTDGPNAMEYLSQKFGGPEQVTAMQARLAAAASDFDIEFHWEQMRRANTFDAHRLLAWALHSAGPEAQRRLKKTLLRGYFTDGLNVADHDVLADLAERAGLDRTAAVELLASDAEADHVRADREEAHDQGISAVPTFVVEDRWMVQGAVGTERWTQALQQMTTDLATG